MAEMLSVVSPPSQKSRPKPFFFPVPSSKRLFPHLIGSDGDGEEGEVLKR